MLLSWAYAWAYAFDFGSGINTVAILSAVLVGAVVLGSAKKALN